MFNFSACFLGTSITSSQFEKLADEVIQIVFKPFGVFNLFGIPQGQLVNLILDASLVLKQIDGLTTQLENEIESSFSRIQKIEAWLLKHLLSQKNASRSPVMMACEKIKESCGTIPIKSLYKMVGMSERSFRYHFTEQTGISPKVFSRIVRFNKINSMLETATSAPDLQDIIYKFGFFDQTHFINEWKWFYGDTPSRLIKKQTKYLNLNALIFA